MHLPPKRPPAPDIERSVLAILDDANSLMTTLSAFERAPVVIRLVVRLNVNEPHRHVALDIGPIRFRRGTGNVVG
jgi:hypothetical protein